MERTERASGDPGDAHHSVAGDRDDSLRANRGDRTDRQSLLGGAVAARGDFGAWRVRGGERPNEESRLLAEPQERARVQHLGAIVRELRCLTNMNAGNEPRVRDDAGIGGQHSGDIFPERDRRRADRTPEQRRSEVGPAAAEGDDGATRSSGAAREDRSGVAVTSTRVNDTRRVDVGGAKIIRAERRRHQMRRQALAARNDPVRHCRGEIVCGRDPIREVRQVIELAVDRNVEFTQQLRVGDQVVRGRDVSFEQGRDRSPRGN